MKPTSGEVRASFPFYAEDSRALRQLNLALRDAGADVERTDTFRLLLHVTSEAELFARAVLRYGPDAKDPAAGYGDGIGERFTVRISRDWVKKLERVRDDLARKDIDVRRVDVARAVLHAPHDVKKLVREAEKFLAEFPDKRTRGVRAQRRG
jgi:hypothetical protein